MMMTEKYHTLPSSSSPSSSSSSFCYSTIYHSPTTNRIRDIKNRLDSNKNSTIINENKMKLLIEQPTIRTYSLYDVQERIDYFEKRKLLDEIETHSKEKGLSNPSSSSSAETLQSVIANTLQQTFFDNESYGRALSRTMMNSTGHFIGKRRSLSTSHLASTNDQKRSNRYCSSLAKRVRRYSLSNHSTMALTAITSFSEEQTTSIDNENTYFYPEETTRLDDALSLTTITSNVQTKVTNTQHDNSVCSDTAVFQSDTEENSEGMTSSPVKKYDETYDIIITSDLQNENIKNNDEQIIRIRLSLTPPDQEFTGVVHATKYTVIKEKEDDVKQCLSDYDNVNHYSEQDNKIRSSADNVSLNKSMTSSMQRSHCHSTLTDEQLLDQEKKRTNENDDDYMQVNQEAFVHLTRMKNDTEMVTHQEKEDGGGGDDDEHYSDDSQSSDDLRYSSDAARNSCASDDLNNTSSTLRQEAISITRVRCKRRKTWIRSPSSPTRTSNNTTKPTSYLQQRRLKTNLIQPFNQADETDARQNESVNSTTITKTATSTVLNQTRVKTTTATTMLLHNTLIDCNNNKNENGETLCYDFIPLNNDDRPNKTNELPMSPSCTHEKDASSPTSKLTNDFYRSSLSPVRRLLNESIDSNIEIIQMDEQECILEIVDGVLTIVPKDKSTSSSIDSESRKIRKQQRKKTHESSKHQPRSSSIASSTSSPSLSEQEQERDELSSTSSSRLSSKPLILTQNESKLPSPHQIEQSTNVLDLFSSPLNSKNLLNDSLSSVSSHGDRCLSETKKRPSIPRSSSPINTKSKSSSSIKDNLPSVIEHQTRSNKSTVLTELLQTIKKSSPTDETKIDYPIPKAEPPPIAKPLNKKRINEFASLLSSSVHLSQPQSIKKQVKPIIPTIIQPLPSSPTRSEDQSFSSIPSASSERDERESYHTIKSIHSEQEQTKKHIDARYNEKLDDRGTINVKTANIKALFEQKISDTNKALSQSSEHLLHLTEVKHQHKKIPISYGSLTRNYQQTTPNNNRRKSYKDPSAMNKYTDHIAGTKDVVIEDKQPENGPNNNTRRHTTEQIVRPAVDSSSNSPVSSTNGYYSESLIAREIRETKEKEEELKRQRKKCGLPEDASLSNNDSVKSDSVSSTTNPVKNSSFLSNLDFFTSKANGSGNESTSTITSPRRSLVPTPNLIYESHSPSTASSSSSSNPPRQSSYDELKQMNNVVSQELNRFNDNGIPIIRTSSTNVAMQRSASNQNILLTQNTNNIIQREIEAIRAQEAELRQLGRIQHTSDEHSDPRKYKEFVPKLPKSQSINTLSTGKIRRDSENQHLVRHNGPMTATVNGFLKHKPNNNSSVSSGRGKFPGANPTAPIVSSSIKPIDYSKLSSTDRLQLEKRQCQEREQELKKQRNSVSTVTSSTNTTINGDSGNVSQEEHDEDQERYFDKIERIKRTENERAHAPFVRPTKKLDMSQKWEQMMANKSDD